MFNMDKIFYSWNDIDRAINFLSFLLRNESIDFITGVPRGGIIPAVMLSHKMNIKYIDKLPIDKILSSNIAIVDDICDSGNTINQYNEVGFITICIDKKHSSVVSPNYFSYIAPDDKYIVYPWENPESEPIADYLKND